MSKLDELIQELCPNGVPFVKLEELCPVMRGKRLTKSQLSDYGQYVVYHGSKDTPLGFYDDYNVEGDTVIVVNTGGIGGVKYIKDNFWCSDGSFWIKHNDKINNKFLYYYLVQYEGYYLSQKRVGGVPTIDKSVVSNTRIPVPPLEVQCEIVRILDKFTLLTAELTAELTARRKQYECYRNNLLKKVEKKSNIMKISEISKNISSGGTPSTGKLEYYFGNIPWLRTQEINFSEIWDTQIKITKLALKNSSVKMIPKNCIIIAMYGATVGKVGINKIPLTTNQACCNIEVNNNIVNYKYLFYWISEKYDYIKSLGQGSQTNINSKIIKGLEIPIPPIDIQNKIVHILEKFDELCNDITNGLPAEIEARQKQYEYYRDKLLTFKEKK